MVCIFWNKMAFVQKLKGFIFLFALAAVSYVGGMFFLPPFLLLLLLPWGVQISSKANRWITSTFFKLAPGLLEVIFGVQVKISGNVKKLEGPCLLIMNHRTRFDWMFVWCYLMRVGDLQKLKIVLKESLKNIPVVGWGMQTNLFIFLSRQWATDEKRLKQGISYFTDTGFPLQLLFFPEGTDLSPSNKEKNHLYASKTGLPRYEYVLHPRTKGFCMCVQEFQKSLYPATLVNLSVGYLGNMPQNEKDIAAGKWPTEIHFHAEQEPLTSLPSNEQGITQWLQKHWEEKEKQLKHFYSKKSFPAQYLGNSQADIVAQGEMKHIMLMWVMFFVYISYSLATSSYYWFYFPIVTTFYLVLNYATNGIQNVFIARSKLFSKLWRK